MIDLQKSKIEAEALAKLRKEQFYRETLAQELAVMIDEHFKSKEPLREVIPQFVVALKDLVNTSCEIFYYLEGVEPKETETKGPFEEWAETDYPEAAKAAILEMYRQRGPVRFEGDLLKSGVIIRHLILPGQLAEARRVMDWVAEHFKNGEVLFSLMAQYTPPTLHLFSAIRSKKVVQGSLPISSAYSEINLPAAPLVTGVWEMYTPSQPPELR